MDLTAIIIQLVSGVVGGNAAGFLAKARSLGPTMNTILGALGGVAGGQFIADGVGGGMAGNVGTSALIGALVPLAVSFFVNKKPAAPEG